MHRRLWFSTGLVLAGFLSACTPRPAPVACPVDPPAPPVDRRVRVTILQLNDVYEITPIENGRVGGLARVAALRARLAAENPNTVAILAGDFFSPSALGTAKVDGARIDGAQMVAVLNALPLDLATFGNHEFDLKEASFRARMAESKFRWISGNVTDHGTGQPFPGVERTLVQTFTNGRGDAFRLGWVGTTIRDNDPDYADLEDPAQSLARDVASLAGQVDGLVALTHVDKEMDFQYAADLPTLDLILGGHEHENWRVYRGADLTPVIKADANARTVYVHELTWDAATRRLSIDSRLVPITDRSPEDPAVAALAQQWVDRAFAAFRASGFEPTEVVATTTIPLDGREAAVRNHETALSHLVVTAMQNVVPGADLALLNTGSIRIDDVVPAGPITQYDVIRILPFGGDIVSVDMRGSTLARTLDQGVANQGTGGFLVTTDTAWGGQDEGWYVKGAPIDPARTYRVAITDYLLTGNERAMPFLDPAKNSEVKEVARHGDIRQAVIAALRKGAP
jgi:5'-nucleotidase